MASLVREFRDYSVEVRGRSLLTIQRYTDTVSELETFLHERRKGDTHHKSLETVTKTTLLDFLREGRAGTTRPSKSTWNIRLAALRAFYDFLFKTERVDANPALRIDRLRTHAKEPVPLTLDEFLALVDAAGTATKAYRWRNVAIIQLFFHTALRVGEMISLDVDQVDFENRVLVNIRTKGEKFLSLPFNDLVSEALEHYLRDRDKLGVSSDERALFLSNRRRRISKRAVQDLLTTYGKRAGIRRRVAPHLLRHSAATELDSLGVPIAVIQDICGHEQITTTRRYTHVRYPRKRDAINALGKAVNRRRRQLGHRRPHEENQPLAPE